MSDGTSSTGPAAFRVPLTIAAFSAALGYFSNQFVSTQIGGQQSAIDVARLESKISDLGSQIADVRNALTKVEQTSVSVAVMQVRIGSAEKQLEKHEDDLRQLRQFKSPDSWRDYQSPPLSQKNR